MSVSGTDIAFFESIGYGSERGRSTAEGCRRIAHQPSPHMPTVKYLAVERLELDLKNYRTTAQPNETKALHALVAIHQDRFWALTESLLDDGYHANENIIVLRRGKMSIVTKEGNRRIAALKLILGLLKMPKDEIPSHIAAKIKTVSAQWKKDNSFVPCSIYAASEAETVERFVRLIHGKGEQAGRTPWEAVARARQNRDMGNPEPGLDLLEKYLVKGTNLTADQAEEWAGAYHLTVLDEALPKIAARIGLASAQDVAKEYPDVQHRTALEQMLRDIGLGQLKFSDIRKKGEDFASSTYSFPKPPPPVAPNPPPSSSPTPPPPPAPPKRLKKPAYALNDPRSVMRAVRAFKPRGNNREKVITLLDEARQLNLDRHAHSFCFLLRSMFEISGKAYCQDHAADGLSATNSSGDRNLIDVLRDITNHLTKNKTDRPAMKRLHGPLTQLANPDGILSVTSLNQLIHNARFSVDGSHISTMFWNVFPLLEAMNE